jgi:hypothetical protein
MPRTSSRGRRGGEPRAGLRVRRRGEDHLRLRRLCRVIGISPTTFYAWAARAGGPTTAGIEEAYAANAARDTWSLLPAPRRRSKRSDLQLPCTARGDGQDGA